MKLLKIFNILVFLFSFSIYFTNLTIETYSHGKANHKTVETSEPYPTLDIKIFKDRTSGYNLQIVTENFRFTPENVNKKNVINEGHVLISINNKNIRVYSAWFHISDEYLIKGKNEIIVVLRANDRSLFVINKNPIHTMKILNR